MNTIVDINERNGIAGKDSVLGLTNLTSQTHSDSPVNVSVNLAEIGTFMNGKLYSDRVNWRCY